MLFNMRPTPFRIVKLQTRSNNRLILSLTHMHTIFFEGGSVIVHVLNVEPHVCFTANIGEQTQNYIRFYVEKPNSELWSLC